MKISGVSDLLKVLLCVIIAVCACENSVIFGRIRWPFWLEVLAGACDILNLPGLLF